MQITPIEGFRIWKQEKIQTTYHRILAEQISHTLDLCHSAGDPDDAVHEIRKSTKRIRALIRLYREETEAESYNRTYDNFRQISRKLAVYRVSKVNGDVLKNLVKSREGRPDSSQLNKLYDSWRRDHDQLIRQALDTRTLFDPVKQLLLQEQERRIPDIPVSHHFDTLAEAIRNTYHKARYKHRLAEREPAPEKLHELRKTVKCLWNQLTLVRPIWPSGLGPIIHQLDLLAENLGHDHDLHEFLLYQEIRDQSGLPVIPAYLLDNLKRKRKAFFRRIAFIAGRVFSERPSSLRLRLQAYYRAYAGESGEY
jgi:CHAD domain-containing protein